jgi:DNA-binding GntR family transcriptional regulator
MTEPLHERASVFLLNAIASGELAPGARINEQDIAGRLEISRGPVREAVRGLKERGLLTFEPNVGARVVQLDFELLNDLYQVRAELEGLAAHLAAERMSEHERSALRSALADHEAQLADAPSRPYPQGASDRDFHRLIILGSRNQMIARICGKDLEDLLLLVRRQHALRPERARKALAEHKRIAEAIEERNGQLAELLMVQHIESSRRNLIEAFSSLPPQRRARRA